MGQSSSRHGSSEQHGSNPSRSGRAAFAVTEDEPLRASTRRRRSLFFFHAPSTPSDHVSNTSPPTQPTLRRRQRFSRVFHTPAGDDTTTPSLHSPSSHNPPDELSPRLRYRQRRTPTETPVADSQEVTDASRASERSQHSLPPLQVPELDLDFSEPATNGRRDVRSRTRNASSTRRHSTNLSERLGSFNSERAGFRNLTASLRRSRTNVGRGDDHAAILARLLSMTATATAASLMGINPESATGDLYDSAGVVDDDGTFHGFLQALRGGRLGDALGRSEGIPGVETNASDHDPPSLDFFRMFRFGSSAQQRRSQGTHPADAVNVSNTVSALGQSVAENGADGDRMVPVLIVGIRSLNADRDGTEQADNMPSFLDALSNMPNSTSSGTGEGNTSVPRHSRGALGSRRRASMAGLNLFSANRDSSRRGSRLQDAVNARSDYRMSTQETPPGPFPPPTTPSSLPVSALSSGVSTPNGRISPSVTSAFGASRSRGGSMSAGGGLPTLEPTVEEEPAVRSRPSRRRLSESDFGGLGSGSSRRNGAYLEPLDPSNQPGEGSRSWIIYILGGNYPENHPILTAPTLFSENPTYEDMLLLSSLLGPVKPPVASEQDLAAAGGMFSIRVSNGALVAADLGTGEEILINPAERCLVCLCDYEKGEDARRLAKCGHLFHRECIDQWLTTGRNSCPLCRSQGVDQQSSANTDPTEAGPSGA